MTFDWILALRYLRSKKRSFISVGTLFAILGVALGVAALATVMSVTGGFQKQFRDKVLGVNAHVLVLKRTPEYVEYRDTMKAMEGIKGVTAVAPFVINPMLVTAGERTATGVLLKGIDPELSPAVLDLPKQILDPQSERVLGEAEAKALLRDRLRRPDARPPARPKGSWPFFDDAEPSPSASGKPALPKVPSLPAKAGAAGDAGQGDPFIDILEHTLQQRQRESQAASEEQAAEPTAAASAAAERPSSTLTPEGGYESELPPDDVESDLVTSIVHSDDEKLKDADLPGIVIGRTLAKNLGVGIHDRIRVTSPAIGFSFSGGPRAPVARTFKVVAIFEAGFDQYDSKLVYVDLYEAQAFYDQGDAVTGVEARISDIDRSKRIKDQVEKLLANRIYHVMDWEELNRPLFTALKIQQIGMSAVLALIIVVAAFTVIATLIMIVLDKQKEIAVLKAMGASDDAILRAFLWQGLIIGGIGTAIGLAIGFAVCKGLLVYGFPLDPKVYFISRLPVEVRPFEFLLTGVIAILICLAATIIPAMHAASVRPAEGLRGH